MSNIGCGILTLAFTALVFVIDPSLSFGRSIGPVWTLILIAAIVISVKLWSLIWSAIESWSSPNEPSAFSLPFIILCSAANFAALYSAANKDFDISRELTVAKIEFYCVKRFQAHACIRLVTRHPQHALGVDKWKRQWAIANLKASGLK